MTSLRVLFVNPALSYHARAVYHKLQRRLQCPNATLPCVLAFKAKIALQLLDMDTVGRSRVRFVAADLLLLLRHYKALALDATLLGDFGGSSLIAPMAGTPHFSDCDTQMSSVVFVDRDSQTSFNKLRYDVGVQDDLFESKVALFNDA
ncbi:hypothetical protein CYMTET_13118 [Cymbomonas tetramitiformis]|uniref:Uncharacterized protein n=1 Tax=Cymbomonas tetramitiformis TaxID=36881 RepID=A0AAE0GIZ5_9CHLO|nr:hypothetical protein CYMTET_13118 [Cymbomonas tetramitiformis]